MGAATTPASAASGLTGVHSAWRRRSTARLPVPRQKFPDAIDWMIGNAGEHVAQISLRVEATHLGGLDEGVHRGGSDAAGVGAGKEIIFSREREGPDRSLDGVVGHLQTAVCGIARQRRPAPQRIADRLGERALAADLVERLVQEGLK